jgi:gamma-glutamylcyclotransferase (GGCT)/AIG2-like uncharacterized protein YtfP
MKSPKVTPPVGYVLPIQLFVYGTLKRGFHNHHLCANASDIQPAWTWGRLYHLRAGFPALEVPDSSLLGLGTDDPVRDARRAAQVPPNPLTPEGDWDQIQGELVTMANADRDLPPIDRLEGFNPLNGCYANLYLRVLVPVWTEDGVVRPVWTYDGRRITARGPRCRRSWPAPYPSS